MESILDIQNLNVKENMEPDVTFVKVMNKWMGPACTFVLPPIPDESRLPEYHHKHVRDIPTQINGCIKEINDL